MKILANSLNVICILFLGFLNFFADSKPPTSITFSFQPIAYSDIDIVSPGRGSNEWHGSQSVRIPNPDVETSQLDSYFRFLWSDIESNDGNYSWDVFDSKIKMCIDRGQKMSFGIMTICTSCKTRSGTVLVENALLQYPIDLHNQMQKEDNPDRIYNNQSGTNFWIPNWNSKLYLSRFSKLLKEISRHLDTGSYKGVKYDLVISTVDVRGYGNWGEWHTWPWNIDGSLPNYVKQGDEKSLINIIKSHLEAFPNYRLINLVGLFTQPVENVAFFGLNAKNKVGFLGWRSDHWGNYKVENYVKDEIVNNRRLYNGVFLRKIILDRWKIAPVIGEPLESYQIISDNFRNCGYYNLSEEVKAFHVSQLSNGNIANANLLCVQENVRAASKVTGYRLVLNGGHVSWERKMNSKLKIELDWSNIGIAPVYEDWDVFFQLRDLKNCLVWEGKSKFSPTLFLPGKHNQSDEFSIDARLRRQNYTLNLIIKDKFLYRNPLPLAIKGRNKYGGYYLGQITL